jgi:hypothetical protein
MVTLESLPRLVAQAERTVQALGSGGLKLDPAQFASLGQARRSGSLPGWVPWVLVLLLIFLLWRR